MILVNSKLHITNSTQSRVIGHCTVIHNCNRLWFGSSPLLKMGGKLSPEERQRLKEALTECGGSEAA